MDFLDNELELPITKEISRDLFAPYAEEQEQQQQYPCEPFNIDKFLLENNFQYISLDILSKEFRKLKNEMDQCLLDEVASCFDDYVNLCSSFENSNNKETRGEEDDSLTQLQQVKHDLNKFMNKLTQASQVSIAKTREVVTDTLEYLKSIDSLSLILQNHVLCHEWISLANRLSLGLQALVGSEKNIQDDPLAIDLLLQSYTLLQKIQETLQACNEISSPFMNNLRNDYQGILQNYRQVLSSLANRCSQNKEQTTELSKVLISILHNKVSVPEDDE